MSARFSFKQTHIENLWVAERKIFQDQRGAFGRMFCAEEFREIGFQGTIVQINYSLTRIKGTVRGLHFQHVPYAEIKMVSCLKGEVYDVAVDLRRGSKTFLSWHGEILSADNQKSMIIPEGFAHGFQTLTDDCQLVYFHTGFYMPSAEGGFNVLDKKINIQWPLSMEGLSDRDKNLPCVADNYVGE